MDDIRSEKNMRHSLRRAHQPNQWRGIPSSAHTMHYNTAREQDFTNNVDDLRFKNIGVSRQLTGGNVIRNKRTLSTIAGERA